MPLQPAGRCVLGILRPYRTGQPRNSRESRAERPARLECCRLRDVDGFNLWPAGKAAVRDDQRVGVTNTTQEGVDGRVENACSQHGFVSEYPSARITIGFTLRFLPI